MNDTPTRSDRDERSLIEAYAAGDIPRDGLLSGLCEIAVPARSDDTGGEGYVRGTRDAIERATREGLLTEDDWNALVARAQDCPALFAID